jgi:hypothetical protein
MLSKFTFEHPIRIPEGRNTLLGYPDGITFSGVYLLKFQAFFSIFRTISKELVSIPTLLTVWLVWAKIECTVHVGLPKPV